MRTAPELASMPAPAADYDAIASGLEGRRVLVTGHTGFKGAWVCRFLHSVGADVAGVSLAPPAQSTYSDLAIAEFVHGAMVDITDRQSLRAYVAEVEPELVVHLAAQPLVRAGWRYPAETFATNTMGTVNVLEASIDCPSTSAIVLATTDKVYENEERGTPFRETDRLGGVDPYSASKAAAELAVAPYRHADRMGRRPVPITTVRAGNVIGGCDHAEDRLLPDILRAFERGEGATLRFPDAIRPWQHVLDCAWGYLSIGACLLAGRALSPSYNLSPAVEPWTVLSVATAAARSLGLDPDAIISVEPGLQGGEHHLLTLDSSLASAELGWEARIGVAEAIDLTVSLSTAADAAMGSDEQIADYRERLATAG